MADHVVPHFHNDPGVPVIEIGAQGIHVRRRDAAVRPSARLLRHGRRQRDHLLLLLDALPLRSGARCRTRRGRPNARWRDAGGRLSRRRATAPWPRSRTVIIAGAGIGGLTAALALARAGFRVVVLEQADAARGDRRRHPAFAQRDARPDRRSALAERLRPHVGRAARRSAIMQARTRPRHRAHPARRRGRAALRRAVLGDPSRRPAGGAARRGARQIPTSRCGSARASRTSRSMPHGVTVAGAHGAGSARRAGHRADRRRRPVVDAARAARRPARRRAFAQRTAWRALVPADAVAPELREPVVELWLGRDAHLVHYPVKAGARSTSSRSSATTGTSRAGARPASRDDLARALRALARRPRAR